MNSPATPLSQLKNFVLDYQSFEQGLALREIAGLKGFLVNFEQKQDELAELMRKDAPNYNLFEVLRIRHYETKVHTPFLAHLLNPKANHHQGRLFFDLFLTTVFQQQFSVTALTNIEVSIERRNVYGQIDIQIWFRDAEVRKAIVIENKIYHHDGDEQLYRYYQYLSETKKLNDCNLTLVYLTLDGRQPSANSLGATPKDCIRTVSYREHISQWLTTAVAEVNPNPVFHTINQYLKTINSL